MYRFGPFEADFSSSELRKSGSLVRIQEQPLRILEALLESPGELVTRERLREKLWPSDTFVDFERSLNAGVAKLRQVLRDSADEPVYVETVARKGYRFIAPVTRAESAPPPIIEPSKQVAPTRQWAAIAVVAVVCVGAPFLVSNLRVRDGANREAIQSTRFSIDLPEGTRMVDEPALSTMAISPDGRTLAVVLAPTEGPPAIWLRPIDSEVMHRLDGTLGASLPFWSPDGAEIGFFADSQLKRIAVSGGSARVLCTAIVAAGGATWGQSGRIIYSSAATLHAVDTSGGPCRQLTKLDPATESRHAWPNFLEDGRRFLYLALAKDPPKNTIFLASLDDTNRHALLMNGSRASFAPPDNLLFVRDGTLFAQQWDFRRYRALQAAVPLANDIVPAASNIHPVFSGSSSFSVSETGVLAYRTRAELRSQIVSYSREGKRLRTIGAPGPYSQFTLSPDEKTFAFLVGMNPRVTEFRIWLMRQDTEVVTRLNFGHTTNADPVWAPDSSRIVFCAMDAEDQKSDLYEWKIGEEKPHLLLSDGRSNKPDDWSQDGRALIYRRDNVRLLALAMDVGGKPIPTGDTDYRKDQSQLSPDGKRIAYNSDRDGGRQEIFVADFPSFSNRVTVSAEGGMQPLWSNKGDELFYLAPDKNLMSVQVRPGSTFETSSPKALFRTAIVSVPWKSQYALSQDRQTVYILEPVPIRQDTIHVITNWNAPR